MKFQERARVTQQRQIAKGIFSLWLKTERIAGAARPGQFLSLYCNEKSRLLPRPISICEADAASGKVRLVYRVSGAGTDEFSKLKEGGELDVIGPLGNGFPLEEAAGKRAFLIGGGIGVPPMVELAGALAGCPEIQIIAGYRDELFLTEELAQRGKLYIATEDGSCGIKGTVLDCIRENALSADVIFACGPTPMLRALQSYAAEQNIPCWLSLEQRMACGIGACLACVCKSVDTDAHSQVKNKRICAEGPVFEGREIVL